MRIKILQHIKCSLGCFLNKNLEFCFLVSSGKELKHRAAKNKRFDGQSPVSSLAAGQMIDCFLYLEHG